MIRPLAPITAVALFLAGCAGGGTVATNTPDQATPSRPSPSASAQAAATATPIATPAANAGLYVASPDLSDLRLVVPLQGGIVATEPFGITPDGSRILFFGETGPDGGTTHAGNVYVVNFDGSGLSQLSPPGVKVPFIGPPPVSLSPDGGQAAFAVDDAVFVVDLDGGEARQVTDKAGFTWAVSWSPTGEWITYTRQQGARR